MYAAAGNNNRIPRHTRQTTRAPRGSTRGIDSRCVRVVGNSLFAAPGRRQPATDHLAPFGLEGSPDFAGQIGHASSGGAVPAYCSGS